MYTASQRMIRVQTESLQDEATLKGYKDKGFLWMRRYIRPFHEVLRNPIAGCVVELSLLPLTYSFPIDSHEARALIGRMVS